jgi:sigma-B regulation protein RsbU (phosphoserine phosphatase)
MNEELYSDEKFIQLLESESKSSPQDLINKIIESVKSFEGEAEQFDDITLLAIRYLQEPNTISSDRTSIKIKNDLKEITTVIDHFEIFGEKNNIAFPIIQKFNIAFDELLNNNISYGFNDDSEHIIDVDIELKGTRLIITITDDGMPFNPFVNNPPDTKLSVSERDIGGLGIHIVKNLMDEYEYKRSADKNIITLIKHNINT